MREVNFLPHERKERMFKKKRNIINYSIIFIVTLNIVISVHAFQGINEIKSKEKMLSNVASQAFNTNSYKEKTGILDFFQENIVGNFLYETANLKGSTLSLKIIIKDKNEFSECVKNLEEIKECNIAYLIAPYEENNLVKFEVGLEVKE